MTANHRHVSDQPTLDHPSLAYFSCRHKNAPAPDIAYWMAEPQHRSSLAHADNVAVTRHTAAVTGRASLSEYGKRNREVCTTGWDTRPQTNPTKHRSSREHRGLLLPSFSPLRYTFTPGNCRKRLPGSLSPAHADLLAVSPGAQ